MTAAGTEAPETGFRAEMSRAAAARTRGNHAGALVHYLAAAPLAPPGDPWPRLGQATALIALGRAEEAETAYRAVLADRPGQVEALRGLCRLARQRGDHDAALLHAEAAALAAPENPWPRLDRAGLLRALGRAPEAEAAYRSVLASHPGQVEALLGLGHLARAAGDHAAALEHFAAAGRAAGPGNPWPRLDEAATLRALGRARAAEALYAAVLDGDPANHQALLGLGLAARERGDRAAAEARFRQAAEAAPAAPGPWIELATERREAADFDAARGIARKLLAADQKNLHAWMSLGRTERAAGRRETALEAFRSAHACRPEDPYPLIEMAGEMHALEQPAEADRLLRRALQRDPRNLQALEQLGEAARLARDFDAALGRFREAVQVRPGSPWAWLGILRCYNDMGRQAEAPALLDEAERHCGPLPEIEAGRIDLLRQAGHWPQALSHARAATAAAPNHAGLWIQRFRAERLIATPAELQACLAAAPTSTLQDRARLHHFCGQAAEESWRLDGAVAEYRQALALRPQDAWALSDLIRVLVLTLDLGAAREGLGRLTRLTASAAILEGRSTNPSQTHLGQILDEFQLDPDALATVMATRGLPPEERVAPLLDAVRRFPDYTPAAMLLMIALRQAGQLVAEAEGKGPSPVPRRIAQFWDQAEPPPEIAALHEGWRAAHPEYAVRRFDDAAARAFLRETCPPAVLAAYRRAREPAQKADIFRLAWLFAEGGWWLDADDRCLAPLDSLATPSAGLVLYQEDYGTLGNNLIGAAPQHPVIGLALDLAVSAIVRGDNDILWFSTGPGLLTRALARSLAGPQLTPAAWLGRIRVLPRVAAQRVVAMHCQVGYKTTERHWSRTAFGRRRRPATQEDAADAA